MKIDYGDGRGYQSVVRGGRTAEEDATKHNAELDGATSHLVGQHAECGLPMVFSHRRPRRVPITPEQRNVWRGDPDVLERGYIDEQQDLWTCPCGCTKVWRPSGSVASATESSALA